MKNGSIKRWMFECVVTIIVAWVIPSNGEPQKQISQGEGNYQLIQKISLKSKQTSYFTISPDGSKVAYNDIDNKKVVVMVNEKKTFEDNITDVDGMKLSVSDFVFSPDSNNIAFKTIWEKSSIGVYGNVINTTITRKSYIMTNDKKVSLYPFFYVGKPVFSQDSKKVSYKGSFVISYKGLFAKGEDVIEFIMINDKKISPEFQRVSVPVFHPNGDYVAYRSTNITRLLDFGPAKNLIMVNDKKIDFYSSEFIVDEVSAIAFSPDGEKIAYRIKKSIMLDGKKISSDLYKFSDVSIPEFSPDGSNLAYIGLYNKKLFLGVNDKIIDIGISANRGFKDVVPVFNSDGNKIACKIPIRGFLKKKYFIMVDGKKISPEFDEVSTPVFSPEGINVAYIAKTTVNYFVSSKTKTFIMLNDKKISPEFDEIVFAEEKFAKTGEIFFAGYNKDNNEIIHGLILSN